MRRVALLAIVLGSAAASNAAAQALSGHDPAQALAAAAFAPVSTKSNAPFARLVERETLAPNGPVRWQTGEVALSSRTKGPVDLLRVSVGGAPRTPGGLPINLALAEYDADEIDVSLIRSWPNAISFASGDLELDLSPHAGVGVARGGGQAEAGAMVRISRDAQAAEKLKDMGVGDGAAFGNQGRWYLYAAASGRAVGMNMLRGEYGWNRAGWTTDPTSALIGDAQVGVGWRKGTVQTSLGYIHREVKGQHMVFGQKTREDSMVAFSLTIKPGS